MNVSSFVHLCINSSFLMSSSPYHAPVAALYAALTMNKNLGYSVEIRILKTRLCPILFCAILLLRSFSSTFRIFFFAAFVVVLPHFMVAEVTFFILCPFFPLGMTIKQTLFHSVHPNFGCEFLSANHLSSANKTPTRTDENSRSKLLFLKEERRR